jgi:predicted dehydrogenase
VIGQGHFAQTAVLPAFAHAQGCELTALFSDDETKLRALRR